MIEIATHEETEISNMGSAEKALVTASGMAAISSSILAFVGGGEHVLTQSTLYGGTQSFLDHDAPRFGISHSPIDLAVPIGAERVGRGGSCVSAARDARAASRNPRDPRNEIRVRGFRLWVTLSSRRLSARPTLSSRPCSVTS